MLTDDDRALLDRPLHGLLTIPPAPGRLPAPRPVWFEPTPEGGVQLFSLVSSPKVRRLEADPQATFVVVRPNGEPEGWVSIEADVTVHRDGAKELADRLAKRYWDDPDSDEHRATAAAWADEDEIRRIVLHPRRVTRT
ncbi:pyridoxamine 5'-phosphate oxidase family protein [Actinomycetospora straminea]|uniref:Pyridoxamine 5'-phosphate oxidase family protein n=1 Tax=Actinomycetospora straminea TaxID=663607 RepID=A0ABP9EI84_9PSEU|nr:pyridoxamine 5'-phosphate oxidase family protein [Actinomycetospora straminea]MDD7933401.1 pyridoxamine 5'-phosphate oxidase family protein [Actinomycetospora straminea]